jgi:hypothetical protein
MKMNLKNTWKRSHVIAATALVLLLTSCGGTPPALPPPPANNGGFSGGGGGVAGCLGVSGTPLWPQQIVASFSGGVSANLSLGVNLNNITGTVLISVPAWANNSYQNGNTTGQLTMCTTAPGQYSNGSVVIPLVGSVPYQMYNGYASMGTSVYNGIPTQYAQVTGQLSGYIVNGAFSQGSLTLQLASPLQQYGGQVYSN